MSNSETKTGEASISYRLCRCGIVQDDLLLACTDRGACRRALFMFLKSLGLTKEAASYSMTLRQMLGCEKLALTGEQKAFIQELTSSRGDTIVT